MKFSRTVAYALQATLQLAQSSTGEPVPCSQLASEGQMPERFLLQILRHLVTHGILHSTRGVDGGYSLDRKPEEISLLDVIEAIDGPVVTAFPPLQGARMAGIEDRLRGSLEVMVISSRRHLHDIKMSDLLGTNALAKMA